MALVVVVGSINLDRVQTVARLPEPGNTVHGSSFAVHHGGKGANQAVAAVRMGAPVRFVGRVGQDEGGERLRTALAADGIDVSSLASVDGPTGFATILVAASGENVIVLEAGANAKLGPDAMTAQDFYGATVALFQLEVPIRTVVRGLELARAAGATTVLNAAPPDNAELVPAELVDVLVVNRGEAARLAPGVSPDDATALAEALAKRYGSVLLTLGADGVVWSHGGRSGTLPARKVEVVDTTGAGDTFTGAFAALLAAGEDWGLAVATASEAAAICVTRAGAQPSIPWRTELGELGSGP